MSNDLYYLEIWTQVASLRSKEVWRSCLVGMVDAFLLSNCTLTIVMSILV